MRVANRSRAMGVSVLLAKLRMRSLYHRECHCAQKVSNQVPKVLHQVPRAEWLEVWNRLLASS